MITIEYSPEGKAVSDHKAEEYVRDLIKQYETTYEAVNSGEVEDEVLVRVSATVSTENIIFAARAIKKETGIDIQFKFGDKILIPNKDGRLAYWPDGFSDHFDGWLMRLF